MKQKTSLFNWGLCRGYLKRCWPLWTTYFAVLLLELPAQLPEYLRKAADGDVWRVNAVSMHILSAGRGAVLLSAVFGAAAAMAMYAYLYNNRACSMVNALPIRRETAFATAFLTGIVPMLTADVLTAAIAAAIVSGNAAAAGKIWTFLAFAVMGNIAFYGFAVFCAMLTGNLAVMPCVYLVLNGAVYLAEAAVRTVMSCVIYGFSSAGTYFEKLSPLVAVMDEVNLGIDYVYGQLADGSDCLTGEFEIRGLGLMGVYCAAGLVLTVCALLIYKKRGMEHAGDIVAVPVLKPVFKYCLSFGCALVLAAAVYEWLFSYITGLWAALLVLAILIAGAFIGYFGAEMLIQKGLRVFNRGWKGFAVTAAILAVMLACMEFDLSGYERYVPESGEVESVTVSGYSINGTTLAEPENIAALTGIHRQIISHKAQNDADADAGEIWINYKLRDGKTVSRMYRLNRQQDYSGSGTDFARLVECVNSAEGVRSRLRIEADDGYDIAQAENVLWGSLDSFFNNTGSEIYAAATNASGKSFDLTPAQAIEFYRECILPDVEDSSIGKIWLDFDLDSYDTLSNVSFSISCNDPRSNGGYARRMNYYLDVTIPMDAERCMKWITENTDIVPVTAGEADPESRKYAEEERERTVASASRSSSAAIIGGADGPTAIWLS